MSNLASNPNALAQTLTGLCNPAHIKAAEVEIKKFTKRESCIPALFQYCALGPAVSVETRFQAALLLKKNISKFLPKFDAATQGQLKAQILLLMTNETEKTISTALAGSVAKLAKAVMNLSGQAGQWPELFDTLLRLGQDPRESVRALDYSLLSQLAEHVSDKLLPHMQTIAQMLTIGCSDASSVVKKEAMLATSAFLNNMHDRDEVNHLEAVLSPMIDVMSNCLAQGDDDSVSEGLEVIQECAALDKTLINDHLDVSCHVLTYGDPCYRLLPHSQKSPLPPQFPAASHPLHAGHHQVSHAREQCQRLGMSDDPGHPREPPQAPDQKEPRATHLERHGGDHSVFGGVCVRVALHHALGGPAWRRRRRRLGRVL